MFTEENTHKHKHMDTLGGQRSSRCQCLWTHLVDDVVMNLLRWDGETDLV